MPRSPRLNSSTNGEDFSSVINDSATGHPHPHPIVSNSHGAANPSRASDAVAPNTANNNNNNNNNVSMTSNGSSSNNDSASATPAGVATAADGGGDNLLNGSVRGVASGSFVRHQFFKQHRASPFSPTSVFVDSGHMHSPFAAEYAHERATYLLEKEAKRAKEEEKAREKQRKEQEGGHGKEATMKNKRKGNILRLGLGKSTQQDDEATTNADEKTNLLSSDDYCNRSVLSGPRVDVGTQSQRDGGAGGRDDDDEEEHQKHVARPKSSRRFTGYFFADTAEARRKSLTAVTLLGIMYCNSIGGGYGLENSIGSGGAFITILGVLILPIIWALPVALCVAELATSVPTNGGFLMWINVSMPAPVYFFAVVATLLLMFVDNAVYPVLFADYLCQAIDCTESLHSGLKIVVLAATCILNLIGVEAVGFMTIIITIMSVSPFFIMFLIHMVKTEGYVNWENMRTIPNDIDWVGLMATLAWNVAGLEQAGSVAEDVKDPQKNFMRAVIPLMGLVWVSYIPPIIAGVSRSKAPEDWSLWQSGYFATVASEIGGDGYKVFTVIGGLFSAFGLLLSCLCLSSRTLAGTGEAAAFPRPVSKIVYQYNERFGTPHWAILINTFFTGLCAVLLDFSSLVAIDQALYGMRILLIFLACIKLRYAYPQLERPFRIPVSADGLTAYLTIPMLFSFGLIVLCAMKDTTTAIAFACLCVVLSLSSYLYCRFFRPHGFDGKIIRVFAVDGLMRAPSNTIDVDAIIRSMQETNNQTNKASDDVANGPSAQHRHDSGLNGGGGHFRTVAIVEDVQGVAYEEEAGAVGGEDGTCSEATTSASANPQIITGGERSREEEALAC